MVVESLGVNLESFGGGVVVVMVVESFWSNLVVEVESFRIFDEAGRGSVVVEIKRQSYVIAIHRHVMGHSEKTQILVSLRRTNAGCFAFQDLRAGGFPEEQTSTKGIWRRGVGNGQLVIAGGSLLQSTPSEMFSFFQFISHASGVFAVRETAQLHVGSTGFIFSRLAGDKVLLLIYKTSPYGNNVDITKLEYVVHVQKRVGTRLRRLERDMKGQKLSDGTGLGGKGSLTDAEIHKFKASVGMKRAGETGDHRENPPTSSIVQRGSHMRKSDVTQPGIEPSSRWWESSILAT
ncbi:hypothetical protein PR048_018689 [Dryococelus australis]|uniref:Uncharacterized protein n=1 Tax=Dryococelus australis TaxID=614101 RepID=A0ABQ9HDE3_9NEOP|nr:hypothetical protein PR048_018689 [Dryococelus australis]